MARENQKHPGLAKAPPKPGDEAVPGTPGTGEDICHSCNGSGSASGKPCPDCGGSGRVIEGIGGA